MFGLKRKQTTADPELKWFKDTVSDQLHYTRDIAELEKKEWQLTFVVDELKSGHHQHGLLGTKARFICNAFTRSSKYSMWTKKLGKLSFGVVLDNPKPNALSREGHVKGQLYLVRPHQYLAIDKAKDTRIECIRRRVPLRIFARGKENEGVSGQFQVFDTVDAWMWVGRSDYWDRQISLDTFKVTQRFHRLGSMEVDYYQFTPSEYDAR